MTGDTPSRRHSSIIGVVLTNINSNEIPVIECGLKSKAQKSPLRERASKPLKFNVFLVEPSGIEPLTSTLPVLRSPS